MKTTLCILAISLLPLSMQAQGVKSIPLPKEPLAYSPKQFYISDVADDQAPNVPIATMTTGGKKENVSLQDGTAAWLKAFAASNIKQNKAAQPMTLHLVKTDINIKKSGEAYTITSAITIAFYAGSKKIIEYSSKGGSQDNPDPLGYTQDFIRQAIEAALKRFDEWWPQNKDHIATASEVQVNVTVSKTTDKPNWIAYSPQKPVQIADFMGKEQNNVPELAATSSGIGMGYASQTEKGHIVVTMAITPYFDKSQSWFKAAGKNGHVLAHEQTHFDITALKACELANAIRTTPLTQANYEQTIQRLQAENNKATNDEQDQYDTETVHGTIPDKQEAWEKKIKQQLKAAGCY